MKTWTNTIDPDDPWRIELEDDVFSEAEGRVVSLYIENAGPGRRSNESGLAALLPDQAREVAAELLRLADHVQAQRAASANDEKEGRA